MSGPIVPPLQVTEVDGSPDGRPITKIIVSNGDLTISGREATIDTSGSATVPGTPATAIQFNSDPAGTFTGSERLVFETGSNNAQIFIKSGASATQTEIRAVDGWGLQLSATDTDNSIRNQIVLFGENDGPDGILLVPNTGENVRLQTGGLTTSASDGDLVLSTYDDEDKAKITLTAGAGGGVVIQTDAAGFLQLENTTTDTDSIFTVLGNGTGTPKVKLENGSMAVQTICEANKEFTIEGGNGGDTFVFDVSSATGGITWPDGTEQITAASGGVSTLAGLTDVSMDIANFTDSLLIQTNSDGLAPTTGVLSTANNNIGIGKDVFLVLTSADDSVGIGKDSLKSVLIWGGNVGVGSATLELTTLGNNTACGTNSGKNVSNGQNNTFVGNGAGQGGSSYGGSFNVAIGNDSMLSVTGYSDYNVAVGANTLKSVAVGVRNIALGSNAGFSGTAITTGSNNVVIGAAGVASATADDQLVISSGDGGVSWVVGDSAGACYQGDNASTWSTTSDRILKHEIVDATVGLDAINAVQVRNFRYIEKAIPITEIDTSHSNNPDDEGIENVRIVGFDGENRYNLDPEPLRVGVIAQEIQDVFPEAVTENAHGHLTVNTDSINWALLKAVQELSAKVEALEANQ